MSLKRGKEGGGGGVNLNYMSFIHIVFSLILISIRSFCNGFPFLDLSFAIFVHQDQTDITLELKCLLMNTSLSASIVSMHFIQQRNTTPDIVRFIQPILVLRT